MHRHFPSSFTTEFRKKGLSCLQRFDKGTGFIPDKNEPHLVLPLQLVDPGFQCGFRLDEIKIFFIYPYHYGHFKKVFTFTKGFLYYLYFIH